MKNLVLFACVLIFASSNSTELKAQLRNAVRTFEDDIKACLNENNLILADLYQEEDIINNSYAEPENKERTKKVGCWIACILKKQNLMEGSNFKEGQIHEKLNEIIDESSPVKGLAHKIVRKCMKEVKSITQECDKSFSLFTCTIKTLYKIHKNEEHEIQETEEEEAETEKA